MILYGMDVEKFRNGIFSLRTRRFGSVAECMIKAVNLGDDADTTGAVYGQLAGAYYGHGAIPKRWTRDLHKHNYIYDLAQSLCNTKMNPTPDPQLDNNPGS